MVAFFRAVAALMVIGPACARAQSQVSLQPKPDSTLVSSPLSRQARLLVRDVPIATALDKLAETSGVVFAFSPSLLESRTDRVTCECRRLTVAEALDEILAGTRTGYTEINGRVVIFRPAPPAELPNLDPAEIRVISKRPEASVINNRSVYYLAIPALLATARLGAQQSGAIVGRVTEQGSGTPVPGVSVAVVGTRLGALTDDQGRFRIASVSDGRHRLSAQRLGYRRLEQEIVVAGAQLTVDFALEKVPTILETIVSTATGTQRSVELGHSVGLVRMDSLIKEAPIASLSEALTARVPGVMINGQNGYGNTVSPIRIRGLNSFSLSNDPIVIVDGARIESTPSQGTQAALCGIYATCPSSRLGDLAMSEIASIEVVKGPAAATLYGTDAANGVLVIRTKRGEAGRTRWELSGEAGTSSQVRSLQQDNYFAWGRRPTGQAVHCNLFVRASAGSCTIDSVTTFNPLLNSETTLFGLGRTHNAGLQVSGGVARFRYFASGSYNGNLGWLKMPEADQKIQVALRKGPVPDEYIRPDYSRRINFRGNMTAGFGDKGELTLSNGAVSSNSRVPVSFAYQSALYGLGYRDPAFDGYYSAYVSRPGDLLFVRDADFVTRYTSSLSGGYRPTGWLSTRATLGVDYSGQRTDFLQRNGEGGNFSTFRLGQRTQAEIAINQYSFDGGATATKVLTSSLTSKTSVGAQYNRRSQVVTALSGAQLPPGGETVAGAAIITGTEIHVDNVVAGAFVEQELAWRDRLFVTAAIRTDGSSSFGRNLRTTAYPKFSLSWLASEESFFPKIPGVTSLRLRAAYGASGVQPPSTAGITRLSLSNASVSGVPVNAASPLFSGFGNPDVKPERQAEYEAGFDLEAWDGRFRTEGTYFSRTSTDALVSVPFAASVGAGSYFANIGSVSNKGVEGIVTVRPIDSRVVALDIAINATLVRNKLVSVGPNAPLGYFTTFGASARHRVGYPLYGLWAKPLLRFGDANNNGFIESSEIAVGDTEVYIGPGRPEQQTAFTGTLSFLRDLVRLTATLDGRGGYSVLNVDYATRCLQMRNCQAANETSTPLARQAAIIASAAPHSTNVAYIGSGAYTRLRELSLTARLGSRVLRYTGASAGTVTFAGRNLHLWTKYVGDPELQTSSSAGSDAPNNISTPPLSRSWLARLNLSY